MGKTKKKLEGMVPGVAAAGARVPLPSALTDFRQESYWDEFFKASKGRPFEWYGDWVSLPKVFRELLGLSPDRKPPLQILMPGCGNSALSAAMYDAGFHNIINVDFNKRVVTEMLRLNVRERPLMKWQVMDITKMQFADISFDVVLDKGSLDALSGEPDEPQDAAKGFLAEVRRVLRDGGKYVCITLAQEHVLGLLFRNFRSGWDVAVYQVKEDTTDAAVFQPLLVVATKTDSVEVSPVKSFFEAVNPAAANAEQMKGAVTVIEAENEERVFQSASNSLNCGTLEDQAVEEDTCEYDELSPGAVRTVKLGGHYLAVILDAKANSEPHMFKAAVFLVPRGRAHEWLFSTEEGQWEIVEAAKAGRLIMVMLDTQQYPGSLAAVQDELSHVVKYFLPLDCKESKDIPYMTTDDGVHRRTVLEEINSPVTGTIKVEDVVLEYKNSSEDGVSTTTQSFYRRLIFDRNQNLIQSDAILVPDSAVVNDAQHKANKKKKKKGKAKEPLQETKQDAVEYRVDHSQLACSYHAGIVAGLALITRNLDQSWSTKVPVRVMVVGLGAGMLPMFLHNHLPFDEIQVVELDGVIGQLAERHFGFVQTDRMKLHIGDGIKLVHAIAQPNLEELSDNLAASHISGSSTPAKDERLHVIIIDADAGDSSLEMSCPPAGFLEESFLTAAKAALVPGGMLAVNVVSRAAAAHSSAASKLYKVFEEVYELALDEDVNRVLFALPRESPVRKDNLAVDLRNATSRLRKLGEDFAPWKNGPNLEDFREGKIRLVPRT